MRHKLGSVMGENVTLQEGPRVCALGCAGDKTAFFLMFRSEGGGWMGSSAWGKVPPASLSWG